MDQDIDDTNIYSSPVMPKLHTSVFSEYILSDKLSGAIHLMGPTVLTVFPASSFSPITLANPKSATIACILLSNRILRAARSLWITFSLWRWNYNYRMNINKNDG